MGKGAEAIGELTPEEKAQFAEWLHSVWKGPKECPICHVESWNQGDHFVYAPIYYQGAFVAGSVAYPSVILICDNCGYTLFFNAVIMDLLVPGPEKTGAGNGS